MKTAVRPRLILALIIIVIAGFFVLLLLSRRPSQEEEVDPHKGQVYIYDGEDWTWYTPLEGVAVNPFDENSFKASSGYPSYKGNDY